MTVDTLLQRLARIPRPQVSPFWSARVTANATGTRHRTARGSRLMWMYWTALVVVGGPFLLTSWERMAVVAAGILAVRAVVVLTARAPRGGSHSLRNDVRPNSF